MERIDTAVIGAGVVGLAVARALAMAGRSVVILEKEAQFGSGISSRNSEVIHAGIHYPHGSLKERLCIEGKQALYAYCESHKVLHRRTGKLTFAASATGRGRLESIARHAQEAGADEAAMWLEGKEVRRIEPALACHAALLTPSSGIVDSHALMLSLLGEVEDRGGMLARNACVESADLVAGWWRIGVADFALESRLLVNAAGLGAWDVARLIEPLDPARIPPRHLAKGSYFAYSGKHPFTRLIYPLPVPGGLGTHLTLDMAGQARFGPDLQWVETENYAVDPARHGDFLAAARRIWPDIDPERLTPAYSGIRPKLSAPGEPAADFVIQGEEVHGLPGLVNLFGIESPGLTASLAIAEVVVKRLH
jgi:L-2-hydroxyglutarate oxidase LhgO